MKKFFLFFLCFILMGGIVIFPSKRDIYDTDVNNREVVIKTDSETAETETTETEITETEIAETEIAETEITEPVISNKPETFLLIGSSYFYYNNVPEMVYNFAKEGTGRDIEMAACSLNGQTILEHARAIKAVIRTEGDLKKLTAAEKKYFVAAKASGETSYDDYVYERYADVLWDYEHNCAKKYSYIVLSPIQRKNSGDGSAETIARSMSSIIGDIGTSDTRFVLHYTQERMKGTLEELIQKQTEIDKSYDTAIEIVKSDDSISDKYLSVDAARAAKAYCNYMMYYGEDKAIKTEKAAFKIYDTNLSRHGYRNDIYLGEGEHLTVLGSYMMAASIYEALYGESDSCLSTFDISEKYFGQTTEESMNLRFKNFYKTNYGLCYNDGEGFKNKDICRAANFIVEQTQLNSMNFTTKADVDAWKSDASKSNFSY